MKNTLHITTVILWILPWEWEEVAKCNNEWIAKLMQYKLTVWWWWLIVLSTKSELLAQLLLQFDCITAFGT